MSSAVAQPPPPGTEPTLSVPLPAVQEAPVKITPDQIAQLMALVLPEHAGSQLLPTQPPPQYSHCYSTEEYDPTNPSIPGYQPVNTNESTFKPEIIHPRFEDFYHQAPSAGERRRPFRWEHRQNRQSNFTDRSQARPVHRQDERFSRSRLSSNSQATGNRRLFQQNERRVPKIRTSRVPAAASLLPKAAQLVPVKMSSGQNRRDQRQARKLSLLRFQSRWFTALCTRRGVKNPQLFAFFHVNDTLALCKDRLEKVQNTMQQEDCDKIAQECFSVVFNKPLPRLDYGKNIAHDRALVAALVNPATVRSAAVNSDITKFL